MTAESVLKKVPPGPVARHIGKYYHFNLHCHVPKLYCTASWTIISSVSELGPVNSDMRMMANRRRHLSQTSVLGLGCLQVSRKVIIVKSKLTDTNSYKPSRENLCHAKKPIT